MDFALWCVIAGGVLILMALAGSVLKRLPLTASMFYLGLGAALGPFGAGLLRVDPLEHAGVLERLTEVAVIVSLFTAGLKLRTSLHHERWFLPVRLAVLSMLVTVALITAGTRAAGVWGAVSALALCSLLSGWLYERVYRRSVVGVEVQR